MKHYGYLVVEGQHDLAFVGRVLKAQGIKQVIYKKNLDPFWDGVIPKTFPVDDNLLKRVPIPAFFENATHSIAIHVAQGVTRLVDTMDETRAVLDDTQIASYGFLLDADKTLQLPQERFGVLIEELQKRSIPLPVPANPGEVAGAHPTFGVYILPDNQNLGTLEDILLQVGQVNYANLSLAAQSYIQAFDQTQLTSDDLEEFRKPAGPKKAHISTMASILKPGRAIQNSIQDNRWLDGDAPKLPIVKAISDFLVKLFGYHPKNQGQASE